MELCNLAGGEGGERAPFYGHVLLLRGSLASGCLLWGHFSRAIAKTKNTPKPTLPAHAQETTCAFLCPS